MKSQKDFEEMVRSVNSEEEFNSLEISSVFASELINARLEKNLTQAELAKLCGMKQSAIARIENGSIPRVDTACKIAKALNTEIHFFSSLDNGTRNQHLEDRISDMEIQLSELTKQVTELVRSIQTHNQINITINKSEYLYNDYPLPGVTADSINFLADYPQPKPWPRKRLGKGVVYSEN